MHLAGILLPLSADSSRSRSLTSAKSSRSRKKGPAVHKSTEAGSDTSTSMGDVVDFQSSTDERITALFLDPRKAKKARRGTAERERESSRGGR